jgi:hypothetical protein
VEEAEVSVDHRKELAGVIGRALLDPKFRGMLKARTADGERPIIPARVEDTVGEILERAAESGGVANVVVRWDAGLMVLALKPARSNKRKTATAPQAVGDSATLGMLFASMAQAGISEILFKIVPSVPPASPSGPALVLKSQRGVLVGISC